MMAPSLFATEYETPSTLLQPASEAYIEHCDIDSSSDDYARRFAGPVGQWMLDVQANAVLQLAEPWKGGSVLDVGGGHAQLGGPLSDAGYKVTILGSDPVGLERPRRLLAGRAVEYATGDIVNPPFGDQSFDVVLAFRLMAHVRDWPTMLRGLCRVARHAVVIDFATPMSVNAVSSLFFGAKRKIEGNTRPFALQRRGQVQRVFAEWGYSHFRHIGQFVAPMAVHRAMKTPAVSRVLEALAHGLGMGYAIGSPVVLRATKTRL
jgi:ubiquinone/menaquinone biosynthesis C-methylase UbiE